MVIVSLISGVGFPVDDVNFSVDLVAVFVVDDDLVLCQDDGLVVLDEINIADILEDRRDVGSDEVEPVTDARDQRRVFSDGYDLVRFVRRDGCNCICAAHLGYRLVDCVQQISVIEEPDQVGDDFRVRLRFELDTVLRCQPFTDLLIVLDDPVVDDGYRLLFVQMRMGVDLCRFAVGRPTCVADSHRRVEIRGSDLGFQVLDLADCLLHLYFPVDRKGDACRVVSSVFQTFQSVDDLFFGVVSAYISYYSAHTTLLN